MNTGRIMVEPPEGPQYATIWVSWPENILSRTAMLARSMKKGTFIIMWESSSPPDQEWEFIVP